MEQNIEFYSNDVLLRGRFFIPTDEPQEESCVVIMATGDGLSGSKSSTYSQFADAFSKVGLTSFVFDFQGLGYSDGVAAELNLTIGIQNLRDAVETVKSLSWVDENRVGLLGSSFGGNVVLLYTGEYDNPVKLLGFKSPASFYPEVHENELGPEGMKAWKETGYSESYGFNYGFYLDGFNHNTYAVAKKITIPCMIVHGEADTVVPVIQSKRLVECLAGETYLEILPGVNHGYKEGDSKEVMTMLLVDWFNERL